MDISKRGASNSSSITLKQLPPLSLYIHIPWCIKKCPYCDFNSHNLINELPEERYIAALVEDLEQSLPLIWGRGIQTIFIGGGTPSLFSGDSINAILTHVRRLTRLSPYAEITIEANPGAVDSSHIKDYARAGVNRISLGVQSFNDKHLQSLGRVHDSEKAHAAIITANRHFANFNLDIMYGLPGQTIDEALTDIKTAISYAPTHLSAYNLTIEPNTAFAKHPPKQMPSNDVCYAMQDALISELASNGFNRYEISAFARENSFCAHNLNYWQFGDYLGIGAGSHSKLSFHDKIVRQVRQKQPQQYMDSTRNNRHIIEDKVVELADVPFEFALNALRLTGGVPTGLFVERTGLPLNAILSSLTKAQDKGFISLQDGNIVPTKLGLDFQNELLLLFLKDD